MKLQGVSAIPGAPVYDYHTHLSLLRISVDQYKYRGSDCMSMVIAMISGHTVDVSAECLSFWCHWYSAGTVHTANRRAEVQGPGISNSALGS